MYNLMMVKSDHYLHMRKALLSTTEFVLIHTPGKEKVDPPVAGVSPSRQASGDAYGNIRHYYPAEKFDEVSLRLAFEQGWDEKEYIPYSEIQKVKLAEKAVPKISDAIKDVKKQTENFSKLLEDIGPVMQGVEKAIASKKAWQYPTDHVHSMGYFYHSPHIFDKGGHVHYAEEPTGYKVTDIKMKDVQYLSNPSNMLALENQLAAVKYKYSEEKKYGVFVKVMEQLDYSIEITVGGSYGSKMVKVSHILSAQDSWYVAEEHIRAMKKTVVQHLAYHESTDEDKYLTF